MKKINKILLITLMILILLIPSNYIHAAENNQPKQASIPSDILAFAETHPEDSNPEYKRLIFRAYLTSGNYLLCQYSFMYIKDISNDLKVYFKKIGGDDSIIQTHYIYFNKNVSYKEYVYTAKDISYKEFKHYITINKTTTNCVIIGNVGSSATFGYATKKATSTLTVPFTPDPTNLFYIESSMPIYSDDTYEDFFFQSGEKYKIPVITGVETLPEVMMGVLKIMIPIGLLVFGMVLVIYLVRSVISRVQ